MHVKSQLLVEPLNIVSRYLRPSPPGSNSYVVTLGSPTKRHQTTMPNSSARIQAIEEALIQLRKEVNESDHKIGMMGPELTGVEVGHVGCLATQEEDEITAHHSPLTQKPYYISTEIGLMPPIQKSRSTRSSRASSFSTPSSSSTAPSSTTTAPQKAKTSTRKTKPIKEESNLNLPIYSYKEYTDPKPFIVYTYSEGEVDDLIAGLKPGPIAFDMEWRFFFIRSGGTRLNERRTSVVQVADMAGMILVIQVHGMDRFPKALQAIIENPDIPKLGVNIMNDGKKIFRDYGIVARNLVELGGIARVVDASNTTKRKIISLAKLTESYCSKRLLKESERTGNWEASLDDRQLDYAANDVHSTLSIYRSLQSIAATTEPPTSIELPTLGVDVTPYIATAFNRSTSQSGVSPQHMRAYRLWHEKDMDLKRMRLELKVPGASGGEDGLKSGTVISYIINALQANPNLPFDMTKLRELVQMDGASWERHRDWLLAVWLGPKVEPPEATVEPTPSLSPPQIIEGNECV